MTESANVQNDVQIETSVPQGAVSLESILYTEELRKRPWRPPDHRKESSALAALAGALAADSPQTILQTVAEIILEVTDSDSSGLSLLTTDDGGKRFYWPAIAGVWKPHIGRGTPRDFGPCGDVLDRNCALLFKHFERRYPYLIPVMPAAEECLVVPFSVKGRAVGTIWAMMHSGRRKFDSEDERLMNVLGQFASLAYQSLTSIDNLKSQMTARANAVVHFREGTESLEAQVAVRTAELQQRNKQLAEATARLADDKRRLERNEAYLMAAQELSHTGSWRLDVQTGEVYWSQEFFKILGLDSERVKPSYPLLLERVHPEDRAAVDRVRSAAIQARRNFEMEYRLLLPGGAIKYVHHVGYCAGSESGNIHYIGAVMDVTERKRVEQELRLSRASLAEAQRLSRTGSFSWRMATGEVEIMWSEQMYRIFELDQGTPVTFDLILSRCHPEDVPLLNEAVARAASGASQLEFEHRLQMPDRSVRYLRVVAHGTRDPDGPLEYIGAVQDVTDRRVSEEALSTLRSELTRAARVVGLGAVAASIAHEVNQPLSGIITNASTCLRMLASDPPNVDGARETARRTIRDGERASEVIMRLRALFAKKKRAVEPVNLNDASREVIALSLHELRRNRVVLRTEFAQDLPLVTGDRVQLQEVILNLLLNALDAMKSVDDRARVAVIRTERHNGDGVRLTVQDVGVGFESPDVKRLFDPFYTTKAGGMGIGLFVSRSIVESHGGRLWATPNDGPGATFSFSIPSARDDATGSADLGPSRASP